MRPSRSPSWRDKDSSLGPWYDNTGRGATLVRHLGLIKYYLGDIDGFFADMEKAAHEHVLDPSILLYSPLFEKARNDRRFERVMEIAHLDAKVKE
jgi:hypothetical protein